MKRKLVQTITNSGNTYGQVSNISDLMSAQDFVHQRISDLAHDWLNNSKANEVSGFKYELGAGNAFDITVSTPGRVYAKSGKSYDFLADVTLDIAAADDEFARLDLVVAVLEDDVNAELNLIPFVRLRTSAEFSAGASPYAPTNLNVATEKHDRAVVQIKTGTPALVPTAPALASNEVPLYMIAVAPGATQLRDADVLDVREVVQTVRRLNEITGKNTTDIAALLRRVEAVEDIGNQLINLPKVFGSIRTLNDILASLKLSLDAARDLPEVRYDHPKLALTDPTTSKIPATGNLTNDLIPIPVVDIEVGGRINFGDKEIILRPENFADATRNARFEKVSDNPETDKKETALTLLGVTQIAADGSADFVEKASQFLALRSRPACAARNGQFIEVFGGLAADNTSDLGDWHTYDLDNDTLTPRAPLSGLPSADRPAMMSCGDGTNVLLICGSDSDTTPQVFKINAASGAVTEITTTKPTGVQFFGDLIAPNKIFIVAIRKEVSGFETDFWEFNTSTNQFTQLGVTGNVPALALDYADGCYYRENEFVLVKFTPGVSSSGETYIFNASSLVWTKINIPAPYGDTAEKQNPLSRFRLANVNGRPLLVGGLLTKETDTTVARIWELQSSGIQQPSEKRVWVSWNASFPPIQDAGVCSVLVGGRPSGKAALLAGQGRFSDAKKRVYASVQGGLIATTYKGQPAISLADSSNFATFVIPVHNNDWAVASYLLSIVGDYTESNLKVEVSFDGGDTYKQVTPDKMAMIVNSDAPGVRHLRFTLYNLKTSKPVLQKLIEVFDEDGNQLEARLVIRYDAPNAVRALYVDRNGVITLSATIEPSTPDKCLLHKVTPNGSSEPVVKNYINRRRPHVKYSKLSDGTSANIKFDNELAVPVRYVDARAFAASGGALRKLIDPEVNFDDPLVEVTELDGSTITSGDTWIVELEG